MYEHDVHKHKRSGDAAARETGVSLHMVASRSPGARAIAIFICSAAPGRVAGGQRPYCWAAANGSVSLLKLGGIE